MLFYMDYNMDILTIQLWTVVKYASATVAAIVLGLLILGGCIIGSFIVIDGVKDIIEIYTNRKKINGYKNKKVIFRHLDKFYKYK